MQTGKPGTVPRRLRFRAQAAGWVQTLWVEFRTLKRGTQGQDHPRVIDLGPRSKSPQLLELETKGISLPKSSLLGENIVNTSKVEIIL